MKICKYCKTEFSFGTPFFSEDVCYKCHWEGLDYVAKKKNPRKGKWSGKRGEKSDYNF